MHQWLLCVNRIGQKSPNQEQTGNSWEEPSCPAAIFRIHSAVLGIFIVPRCYSFSVFKNSEIMPSLLFCGPKLAACGIVLSIWGVIMLVSGGLHVRVTDGAQMSSSEASQRIINKLTLTLWSHPLIYFCTVSASCFCRYCVVYFVTLRDCCCYYPHPGNVGDLLQCEIRCTDRGCSLYWGRHQEWVSGFSHNAVHDYYYDV